EPAAGLDHAFEVLIASQRCRQGGEQLVGRKLRLGLVIVAVAFDDDASFRRLSGLSGTKNDADGLVPQVVADIFDEVEAGRIGFHDDVEQYGSDIGMGAHQGPPLRGRIGRKYFERLPVEAVVAQRKSGAFVHGMIVVDDRDLPLARSRRIRSSTGIVDQVEDIVLFGHEAAPSRSWSMVVLPPLAALGMIMRNVVPCPSLESSIIRPPSCWVTRL